jgi:hypothetical protein
MLIERLDRTQWKLAEVVEHVRRQLEPLLATRSDGSGTPPWVRDRLPAGTNEARHEILVALRDGDLHATGRLSTRPNGTWAQGSLWQLHSGHHTGIAVEHWRGCDMNWHLGALTGIETQFIDIRVARFMVLAIWPDQPPAPTEPDGYRTPYLELLERAIAHWRITGDSQPKKDNLVDWFLQQTVEGEPLSENLASAMATLVRMPSSQRGGAKRMGGG